MRTHKWRHLLPAIAGDEVGKEGCVDSDVCLPLQRDPNFVVGACHRKLIQIKGSNLQPVGVVSPHIPQQESRPSARCFKVAARGQTPAWE
jgi:hypothetical protein